jgi:hypothetical protein
MSVSKCLMQAMGLGRACFMKPSHGLIIGVGETVRPILVHEESGTLA